MRSFLALVGWDLGGSSHPDYLQHLIKDARKYQATGKTGQVMISFTSDPYHLGDTTLTRQTIEVLKAHGLGICTLTKGGTRALRDIDLFRRDRDAFASTLTTLDPSVFKKCETGIAKTPANATINRELALLRAAINLGRKGTPPKVHTVPYFPMLDESDNIRKGFLKDEQIQKLAEECGKVGLWLRTLFEVGVQFGWRVSEPLSLRVSQIDFSAREIHMTDSKNGNGRIAYILDDTLLQLLKACCEGKVESDFVLTRERGKKLKKFTKVKTF